ncbi:tRNA lysidine(34) synthetase TilS [Marinobacter piscensis]|uniref:tRNA lysidine(34) synthetase TilS n=1 Tax=Marinobacter piscensis TaxID=1562308 RepID=UPI0011A88E96|nr:tRNA lysidine(34) synthetase TilS [Marinobacter piscensis]
MTQDADPAPEQVFPEQLSAPVAAVRGYQRLWVALSGGLDSTLLLHLAALSHPEVQAVHINHQLQVNAGDTQAFCEELCSRLGVPLTVRPVSVKLGSGPGEGLEEAARNVRYQAFKELLEPGDVLLMAHHGDDQAETVLFRMCRGTGVAGLAGMPESRPLGAGRLARPLLGIERSELERYARQAGLSWVDDPSNSNPKYDRNFLRLTILPALKKRWPGLIKRLQHSAGACSESDFLNQRLAQLQWQAMGGQARRLSVEGMRALSLAEKKNLLRWWVRRAGFHPPAVSNWSQVLHDLLQADTDRSPELRGSNYVLRRYQGDVYLVGEYTELPKAPVVLQSGQPLRWGEWKIQLIPASSEARPEPRIRVCTRQGGERVRFTADGPSKLLKKWLQEQAVPPWERARLPLIFSGPEGSEDLVGIGSLWCSGQYCGDAPAAGWRLVVEREFD